MPDLPLWLRGTALTRLVLFYQIVGNARKIDVSTTVQKSQNSDPSRSRIDFLYLQGFSKELTCRA